LLGIHGCLREDVVNVPEMGWKSKEIVVGLSA
jgi:hypothetical protein